MRPAPAPITQFFVAVVSFHPPAQFYSSATGIGAALDSSHAQRKEQRLNLYRIMADVRASADHRSAATGEFGIVTIWLRASSVSVALGRAGVILKNRRYSSIGTLHCYAEELAHDPLDYASETERARERSEDRLLAGYDALKESALTRADGLHEIWLGHSREQRVPTPARAA